MNNAAVVAQFRTAKQASVSDMTRRFGYSGGVPNLAIAPKASGLSSACVPGGQLLLFAPRMESRIGLFDKNKGIYPQINSVVPPVESQTYVNRKFRSAEDFGYRNLDCLTPLPYEVTDTTYTDAATEYFELLHPPIKCDFGLESVFRSGAAGNVDAEWYQACPTCRLKSLQSEEITARIANSTLDQGILIQLRETLIDACNGAIRLTNRKIDDINSDIEKRSNGEPQGRTSRNEIDYINLKMVHRTLDPKKEQSALNINDLVATVTASVAAQFAAEREAEKEKQMVEVFNDPLMAEFLEYKAAQTAQDDARSVVTNEVPEAVKEKDDVGDSDTEGDENKP